MATRKGVKKPAAAKKNQGQSRNLVPLYVLAILALSAALIAVLNIRNADVHKTSGSKASSSDVLGDSAAVKKQATPALQTADTVQLPSKTVPAEETSVKAKVYFMLFNEKTGRIVNAPIQREIKNKDDIEGALKEAVKGPSSAESDRGYVSALPKNLKIKKVITQKNIAEIELSKEFAEGIQGDAAASRVNQMFYTATQFQGIKGIIIRINGKPVKTLGSDGLILNWPMTKPL